MKNYSTPQIIAILTPFVFSFALGLDIYIPIVPEMLNIFNTTPGMIQVTLSLFLFMTGFGQLFIGPLADQFGRKIIFYLGSVLYALGALGGAFSEHIYMLIFSRFICAIGACGMMVTSYALIRDLFSSDESAKMYSYLNGAVGISPTFAPIIGGYLAYLLGWKSVFYFLTAVGVVSIIITRFYIRESLPVQNRVPMDKTIWKRYLHIFTHRQFLIYSLIAGIAEGIFFCFFSISPFIIIETLEVPAHAFGYYFAVFGSVIALGGFASGKIIEKINVESTMNLGFLLMLLGGSCMLAWQYIDGLSLTGFLIPMAVACTGAMFVVGGSAARSLEPFGAIAGTASAAFGAAQFGTSSIAGSLVMIFPLDTSIPYALMIVIMTLLCYGLFSIRPKPALLA